ncbi:PLP-dependent transferase [candidate division KSB1 bacterium]|nr:PLP-dependent transferase [candidate division KSB1 bacterium]NIR72941.1 PLP-dependent transferase [candidate division KSB1 bacterium]NIS28240.1 PLP-dependent transferase [candidate division KSB1 bacterium]NIT75129.1 PLP-dependent transferase [candidate division KSB1 bacterium]NIU28917.1 PLP-dependent transferase [candidate division KSB1 bacterium]
MSTDKKLKFATKAVHEGGRPDPDSGAISTPIYQTSTYVQQSPGVHKGYEYGRTGNPTRKALEEKLAALESGAFGFAFSSGMAATSAIMGLAKNGEHVIVTDNVYGGTYRYFQQVMTDYGLSFSFVDTSNPTNIEEAVQSNTRMVFVETPTNPLLKISNLRDIAEFCRKRNLLSVVDNTFLSPYFQRPLELGIDIVVHSSTKYINGHSDVIGGIVVVNGEKLAERLAFLQNAVGAVPSPLDCWLILRATKTLHLRLQQQNRNAIKIAKSLAEHPRVTKVIYPGLETHPHHELAKTQQLDPNGNPGFGGMLSFELGNWENAKACLEQLSLFSLAESLGGVESLICHPASMTHASIPEAERKKIGLTNGLVRISAGVEDAQDLIEDLEQALAKI